MMKKKKKKQISEMCKAFCLISGIKYTRKFERRYIKEFQISQRMEIKPRPAIEGDTD